MSVVYGGQVQQPAFVTTSETRVIRDVRTGVPLPLLISDAGCSNKTSRPSSSIPGDDPRDEEGSDGAARGLSHPGLNER